MVSIYQSIARDSRDYQYKKQIDKKIKESEAIKKRRALNESTTVNVTPDGNVSVNVDNTPVAPVVPEVVEPEVAEEVTTDEVIEECSKTNSEEVIEEGCSKDDSEEVKECGPVKEEDNNEEESEDDKKTITESEEEIGKDVIDTIVAKISAEDEELANKVKEILSKEESVEEPEEEVEEVTEEVIEEEPLEECEISSFKITRIAPKSQVYMLEAQTKDGLRFITGKNFNEETKVLDEAEISEDKAKASDRFRKLMKGE
jgi:hypothetical protein